jgi:hypothetical protein
MSYLETVDNRLSTTNNLLVVQSKPEPQASSVVQVVPTKPDLKSGLNSVAVTAEPDASYDLAPHPWIVADRENALMTIQSLLSAAQQFKNQLVQQWESIPACPYQQTLHEYLGPDFKCPSVDDLCCSDNFSIEQASIQLQAIGNKYEDILTTHLNVMSAEACDTGFPGITSQNLGNAFAVLSTTADGQQYVIDRDRASKHLEFAEIVRNIPVDRIIADPIAIAYKLVSRYVEVHS